MYLFVAVTERKAYYEEGPHAQARTKARLERASGERCLIVPYQEFGPETVREFRPTAVVMSGFGRRWDDYHVPDFLGMDAVIREADVPMLLICGSHQLAGFCFNRDLRRVKRLRDQPMWKMGMGETAPRQAGGPDSAGLKRAAHFVASGYYEIERLRPDPLFAGLPDRMILRCSHYCEVKKLPPGFECLARSAHCGIEAMKHRARCVYGVQFHPEYYEHPYFHGRRVLENFAKIARAFWKGRLMGDATTKDTKSTKG